MSSCFSGGGGGRAATAAAYRLESLDLEMIKSPPSTTSWISSSSSPSSTLSESSTLAISTRKPRTPRKRSNQIYNEAAALLSTAYPKLFPPNHAAAAATGNTAATFNKSTFSFEPSDLLIPLRPIDASAGFLPRRTNWAGSNGPGPFERAGRSPSDDGDLDFDVGSIILDEEVMGEGIDCVMGDFSADRGNDGGGENGPELRGDFCYGYPMGLGFETGEIGMRKEARGIRDGDGGGDWWRFPSVAAVDSNQRAAKGEKRKKKKKKVSEIRDSETKKEDSGAGTMLKLDYEGVLEAWSDKASPFAGESEVAGRDVQGRLAQIDLFGGGGGGGREASMLRYREKRRNRLFSKKIIYQVRKVNADRRPRMKGRFVRTRDSSDD